MGSVESAGMCRITFNEETQQQEASCYGKSFSLGVESRHRIDAEIIEKTLNEFRF